MFQNINNRIKLCTLTLGDDINHMFQEALAYIEKNNHHNNDNHWTLKCVVKVGRWILDNLIKKNNYN